MVERTAGRPGWKRLVAVLVGSSVLLALVGLLALPGEPKDAWDAIQDTGQSSAVMGFVAALAVLAGLFCVRRLRYRQLQYDPGPIQVLKLEDATARAPEGEPSAAPVQWLDMYFRQVLSDLRLSATTPTPGTTTTTDFVDLLESSKIDAKQPFALIGRMARIVNPSHAYEVKATLVERETEPRFGAMVEITTLPRRRPTLRIHWMNSWEIALDRCANAVAAEVIPRSRHSKTGVWAGWRGQILDDELVDLYQRGERLRAERRFEESLGLFYEAVRRDPRNGHLRLALGATQEELALYIDALLTYRAIPHVTRSIAARGRARREALRVESVARYRWASLLGLGEGLAEQWLAPPKEDVVSRRSEELDVLRDRLRPALKQLWQTCTIMSGDLKLLAIDGDHAAGLDRLLNTRPQLEVLDGARSSKARGKLTTLELRNNRKLRVRRLHLLFQLLAAQEATRVVRSHRPGHDRAETGLTNLCVELLPKWAGIQSQVARERLRHEINRQTGCAAQSRSVIVSPASLLSEHVQARIANSAAFIDHYMAARIFAVALLMPEGARDPKEARENREELAACAVRALRRAVDVGGSAALAARWDAILGEDDDLAELRASRAFRHFESEWLPAPTSAAGEVIERLNGSRYTMLLCASFSGLFEDVWHARAVREGDIGIREARSWLRYDETAWRLIAELADHHRHWQTRLKIIQELQRFAYEHQGVRLRIAHPRRAELPRESASVQREARRETEGNNRAIKALGHVLRLPAEDRVPGFAEWEAALRSLEAAGLPPMRPTFRELAENRAAAWRALRVVFEGLPAAEGLQASEQEELFRATFRPAVHALADLATPVSGPIPVTVEPALVATEVTNGGGHARWWPLIAGRWSGWRTVSQAANGSSGAQPEMQR